MIKSLVFFLGIASFASAEETSMDASKQPAAANQNSDFSEIYVSQYSTGPMEEMADAAGVMDSQMQQDTSDMSEYINSYISIGPVYSYVWLSPTSHSPTFRGSLGGAQGFYEYRPDNYLYQGVKLSWKQGSAKHESSRRSLLDIDVHGRIGYTLVPCDPTTMNTTLFVGLGYRYLGQKLTQPHRSRLSFNYNEFYIPVGFQLIDRQIHNVTLGFNCTWMPQVYPAVTIKPLDGANWIIKRTFGNVLVEIPITYFWDCYRFTVELRPFFEYWQDGQTIAETTTGLSLDVPRNSYLFAGAELNFGWLF